MCRELSSLSGLRPSQVTNCTKIRAQAYLYQKQGEMVFDLFVTRVYWYKTLHEIHLWFSITQFAYQSNLKSEIWNLKFVRLSSVCELISEMGSKDVEAVIFILCKGGKYMARYKFSKATFSYCPALPFVTGPPLTLRTQLIAPWWGHILVKWISKNVLSTFPIRYISHSVRSLETPEPKAGPWL